MLKSLTLRNWKSFGEERNVVPFAPLTLLVGPNASGKSNALDALRFLQGAAFAYSITEILNGKHEGGRQVWPGIRGGFPEAAGIRHAAFVVRSEWAVTDQSLHHVVRVVSDESTPAPSPVELRNGAHFNEGGVPGVLGCNGAEWTMTGARGALSFVAEPPSAVVDDVAIQASLTWLQCIRGAMFLDIQPQEMRDYRPSTDVRLSESGANVASVLASLDEGRRSDITDWVDELWSTPLTLGFDRTQLDEIMLYVHERGRMVSARSLSFGTLRYLGLVTALLTAAPGSIVIVEEPDLGMHPSRIHLLAQLLESVASNRRVQVIATTHSPTLLAHLTPDVLGNVVAMSRATEDGTTTCRRLAELPHFEVLRDSDHLDHLVSTGWIERAQ